MCTDSDWKLRERGREREGTRFILNNMMRKRRVKRNFIYDVSFSYWSPALTLCLPSVHIHTCRHIPKLNTGRSNFPPRVLTLCLSLPLHEVIISNEPLNIDVHGLETALLTFLTYWPKDYTYILSLHLSQQRWIRFIHNFTSRR